MFRQNFGTVIDPTCGGTHVLCEDGGDGTAAVASANKWGAGGGVTPRRG
jgi:hypothetical protein